jgi:hypothetical protein
MRILISTFLFFVAFSTLAFAGPKEDLLALDHRPTVAEIKAAFNGELPGENPFGTPTAGLQQIIFDNAPAVIAAFERAFPGATFAPLGRDSVFLGDLLDGFYASLGQHRIVRVSASGASLTDQKDLIDFMKGVGADLTSSQYPFIMFDQTNFKSNSQSVGYLNAMIAACQPPHCDPGTLAERFNFLNTGSSKGMYAANIIDYKTNIPAMLEQQRTNINANKSHGAILSVAVPTDLVYTAEYHGTFSKFTRTKDGRVITMPGAMSANETRLQILADVFETIKTVSSRDFLTRVKAEATLLGYAYSENREAMLKNTRKIRSRNLSSEEHAAAVFRELIKRHRAHELDDVGLGQAIVHLLSSSDTPENDPVRKMLLDELKHSPEAIEACFRALPLTTLYAGLVHPAVYPERFYSIARDLMSAEELSRRVLDSIFGTNQRPGSLRSLKSDQDIRALHNWFSRLRQVPPFDDSARSAFMLAALENLNSMLRDRAIDATRTIYVTASVLANFYDPRDEQDLKRFFASEKAHELTISLVFQTEAYFEAFHSYENKGIESLTPMMALEGAQIGRSILAQFRNEVANSTVIELQDVWVASPSGTKLLSWLNKNWNSWEIGHSNETLLSVIAEIEEAYRQKKINSFDLMFWLNSNLKSYPPETVANAVNASRFLAEKLEELSPFYLFGDAVLRKESRALLSSLQPYLPERLHITSLETRSAEILLSHLKPVSINPQFVRTSNAARIRSFIGTEYWAHPPPIAAQIEFFKRLFALGDKRTSADNRAEFFKLAVIVWRGMACEAHKAEFVEALKASPELLSLWNSNILFAQNITPGLTAETKQAYVEIALEAAMATANPNGHMSSDPFSDFIKRLPVDPTLSKSNAPRGCAAGCAFVNWAAKHLAEPISSDEGQRRSMRLTQFTNAMMEGYRQMRISKNDATAAMAVAIANWAPRDQEWPSSLRKRFENEPDFRKIFLASKSRITSGAGLANFGELKRQMPNRCLLALKRLTTR